MTISELKIICEKLENEGKGDYTAGICGEVTGRCVGLSFINDDAGEYEVCEQLKMVLLGDGIE